MIIKNGLDEEDDDQDEGLEEESDSDSGLGASVPPCSVIFIGEFCPQEGACEIPVPK